MSRRRRILFLAASAVCIFFVLFLIAERAVIGYLPPFVLNDPQYVGTVRWSLNETYSTWDGNYIRVVGPRQARDRNERMLILHDEAAGPPRNLFRAVSEIDDGFAVIVLSRGWSGGNKDYLSAGTSQAYDVEVATSCVNMIKTDQALAYWCIGSSTIGFCLAARDLPRLPRFVVLDPGVASVDGIVDSAVESIAGGSIARSLGRWKLTSDLRSAFVGWDVPQRLYHDTEVVITRAGTEGAVALRARDSVFRLWESIPAGCPGADVAASKRSVNEWIAIIDWVRQKMEN